MVSPGSVEGNTDEGTDMGSPHGSQAKGAENGDWCQNTQPSSVGGPGLVGPGVLTLEPCLESAFGGGVHEGPSPLPSLGGPVGPVSTGGISLSLSSLAATGPFQVAPLTRSSPASASLIWASNIPPIPAEDTGVSSQNLTFLWCVKIC